MKKNRTLCLLLISLLFACCSKNEEQENPTFIFQNPKTLVEAVSSNYVIVPHFGPNAQEIIFNGKLFREEITTSPSGKWILANKYNGKLSGLIDIKTLYKETLDSVKLYLLSSTKVEEIELNNCAVFPKCEPEKWSSVKVPIKGLSKLRNRPIVIRGILEGSFGIQMLPATIMIDGENSQLVSK